MNKDKISSQEIIDLVASKAKVSKRAAEEFLKTMISSIEEALMAGEVVKVKNFGTFKLQWNEPRKSVNVQTGEEIMLPGYNKVNFIPDSVLRELVNEPFAHLFAVELDGEKDEINYESSEVSLDPLRIFEEQASEIKDLLLEIQALSSLTNNPKKEDEIVIEKTLIPEDETLVEIIDEIEEVDESIEIIESIIEDKEAQLQDNQVIIPESNVIEPIEIHEESILEELEQEDTVFEDELEPKKRKLWLRVLIVFVVLIAIGCGVYFVYPPAKDFADSTYERTKMSVLRTSEKISITDMVNTISGWFSSETKNAEIPHIVVIPKDTTAIDSVQTKNSVDSLQALFDNPRVYTEFIATEKFTVGSRLTRMAKRYYGSKDFWVYIYEANKAKISDPDVIPIGTVIKIPKLNPILIDVLNPRCIQKAKELHDLYVK
jgi:nucleoid DNA-binding protein